LLEGEATISTENDGETDKKPSSFVETSGHTVPDKNMKWGGDFDKIEKKAEEKFGQELKKEDTEAASWEAKLNSQMAAFKKNITENELKFRKKATKPAAAPESLLENDGDDTTPDGTTKKKYNLTAQISRDDAQVAGWEAKLNAQLNAFDANLTAHDKKSSLIEENAKPIRKVAVSPDGLLENLRVEDGK